jgi:soluble lytic murein transglycosylase
MTPPTATATARRNASRRSQPRRRNVARRRVLSVAGFFALVAIGVVLALPLFRKAVADLGLPLKYSGIIRQQAAQKQLDPALIAAVIDAETKFEPSTSSAGALGLMQILPQTAEYLAHRSGGSTFTTADLGEPAVNIAYGSYYLRYLLDHYGGNEMLAIAAYNGGVTNVDRWLARARAAGQSFSLGDIPFPETRAYVSRVLTAQKDYRNTYPSQLGYG